MREKRAGARVFAVLGLTLLTAVVATGLALLITSFADSNDDVYGVATSASASPPAGATTTADGGGAIEADPTAQTLTFDTAAVVLGNYQQSRDRKDAALFASSTCQKFLDADMKQRGLDTVDELLNAYERAKKYVPVQFVEDIEPLDAGSTGTKGWIEIRATITDNRTIPPTPDRRAVKMDMTYEQGRWKLCPTIDPI